MQITVDIRASKSASGPNVTVGSLIAPFEELPTAISLAIKREIYEPEEGGYSSTVSLACECTPWDGEGEGTTVVYPRIDVSDASRIPRANALTVESIDGEEVHVLGGRVCYREDGERKLFVVGAPLVHP